MQCKLLIRTGSKQIITCRPSPGGLELSLHHHAVAQNVKVIKCIRLHVAILWYERALQLDKWKTFNQQHPRSPLFSFTCTVETLIWKKDGTAAYVPKWPFSFLSEKVTATTNSLCHLNSLFFPSATSENKYKRRRPSYIRTHSIPLPPHSEIRPLFYFARNWTKKAH